MKEKFLEFLKAIDYKPVIFKLYETAIRPELEKYVADTETKWDDLALSAVDTLVNTFLKPDAPVA